jgi:hypothetical protein
MSSSWGFLNSLASNLSNNGGVHDYAHASQVFRTSGFARSPKYKFLYYVNFVKNNINTNGVNSISSNEIGVLVKSIDLPKFTIDVKDLNQYNRHTYVQDRIKYEPITIKFHDDNNNGLRELWQDYYTYYYADGLYPQDVYNNDDRYTIGNHVSSWGLDNGSITPFFSAIEIYSMYGGQANKITLMNPVITAFSHDTHDYSDAQSVMEATMQIRYNAVVYESGFVNGIPGFNESATYDTNPSPLSGQFVGQGGYINPITGQFEQQGNSFTNPYSSNGQQGSYGFLDQGNQYNPSSNQGLSPQEINNIVYNNNSNQVTSDTSFPVADTNLPTIATAITAPPSRPSFLNDTTNPDSTSDNNIVVSPYTGGSWQQTLWQQGYSADQINSATGFVNSVPQSTLSSYGGFSSTTSAQTLIAQQYIDNPSSMSNIGTVNYGQPTSVPSGINFSDPASPPSPTYNSNSWQATLASQGYSQSDISIAESHFAGLNIPSGTNLVPIAQSYISYSANK